MQTSCVLSIKKALIVFDNCFLKVQANSFRRFEQHRRTLNGFLSSSKAKKIDRVFSDALFMHSLLKVFD